MCVNEQYSDACDRAVNVRGRVRAPLYDYVSGLCVTLWDLCPVCSLSGRSIYAILYDTAVSPTTGGYDFFVARQT